MADYREKVNVGRSSLKITRLGLGTASFGFLYEPVATADAVRTMHRAYELGLNYFDTAPMYANGLAERRLGLALKTLPREGCVVGTKVGFVLQSPLKDDTTPGVGVVRDYSYDGVMRSVEDSLGRLEIERVDILHIHDPDDYYDAAITGGYRALRRLRDDGVIGAVSAGMNQSAMLARFALEGQFDCFLLAGRYTLLDQSAMEDLLPIAERNGITILLGGPLNSGILADPYAPSPKFNYGPASVEWVQRARAIDEVCQQFGVPLKAAALQFPLGHRTVGTIVSGARSVKELEENCRMMEYPVPTEVWEVLKTKQLIHPDAPVPN